MSDTDIQTVDKNGINITHSGYWRQNSLDRCSLSENVQYSTAIFLVNTFITKHNIVKRLDMHNLSLLSINQPAEWFLS